MTHAQIRPGLFITLEGGEGVGKTSQISRLKKRFEALGRTVVTTREPGGTPGAEIMRHVLLSGAAEPLGAEMETILFSAARADHVEMIIRPALQTGHVVLCDRFIDSTRVYQGASGKVSMEFLRELEEVVCDGAWPDMTLLLDLDPEIGMERAGARRNKNSDPDRFEKDELAQQKKRRNAFLKIAKAEPKRIAVIDASGTEKQVSDRIWKAVIQHLPDLKEIIHA